ncbi:MAG: beta-ketoacyl-[acyl-carrier-protein] synthase family protein [SAR324 cluster bacterium]|nr:beta-ketoacyl-[acyl-carrier-protein] synthase family protein [SAR324 cluster bacterium]
MAPQRQAAAVVTGLGLATSLGFGVSENWARLLAGESAIRVQPRERFALPISLPVLLGAAVARDAIAERIRRAVPRSVWNTSAEVCHLWLLAALEALEAAGLRSADEAPNGPADPHRTGIYVGCGAGAHGFAEQEYINVYTAEKAIQRDVSRFAIPMYMSSSLAGQLSILTGLRGPALVFNTACSSGATALLMALDAIRLGRIDCALAGGVEMPLGGTVLKGFYNLGALSTRNDLGPLASRPFDAERDGFVLGEGAACLVLERDATAQARGARPLAVLRGGAASSEAHSLLSQREDGAEIARCIRLALAEARLKPEAVGHVYTHGTGTPVNDRCEALALNDVLPHRPTVSATKALLGHTIGAAAAIDAVLAVRTLATGRPVPVRHVSRPDPGCGLTLAEPDGEPDAALQERAVLVESFAFGGHNAALLFTGP